MADRAYQWFGAAKGAPHTLVESDTDIVLTSRDPKALGGRLQSGDWSGRLGSVDVAFVYPREDRVVLSPSADDMGLVGLDARIEFLDRAEKNAFPERALRFKGKSHSVLVTRKIYVRFGGHVGRTRIESVFEAARQASKQSLTPRRVHGDRRMTFDVTTDADSTDGVFNVTEILRGADGVERAYPHLAAPLRPNGTTEHDWPLRTTWHDDGSGNHSVVEGNASVVAAWTLGKGMRRRRFYWFWRFFFFWRPLWWFTRIRVAVLDKGMDISHPEFSGWSKVSEGLNSLCGPADDPRPLNAATEDHGTTMAGLAVGNGTIMGSGTAPDAGLMPIRLMGDCTGYPSATSGAEIRDAFFFARDHGADVISCSWDSPYSMPDDVSKAIEDAAVDGRGGKGCTVLFSAGLLSEYAHTEENEYASHEYVISVGACDELGGLSETPKGPWCLFPTAQASPHTVTQVLDHHGIEGLDPGDYTQGAVGGPSHATAATAGVVALVLARNYGLMRDEVKDLLAKTCDRVDAIGASYAGDPPKSDSHGHGRVNALRAVRRAATLALSLRRNRRYQERTESE